MNKVRQVSIHAIIWFALILLFMYMGSQGRFGYKSLVIFGYFGIVNVLIFYFNYLLLLPVFLNRKKYLSLALSIAFVVVAAGFVKCGLAYYFYDIVIIRGPNKTPVTFWDYYVTTAFVTCFFLFLSTVLKFMADWFTNDKIKSALENEKLLSELAFLKSQINPHFLFNSLNNIYSLAYQKSPKTPEAILKLSAIMRYMLYESNADKVLLTDEIRYLENYIELQKLRFKDQANVEFEISGEVENLTLMPLVLISFVENAFKHGIATDKENPIAIRLIAHSSDLQFTVTNKKSMQNKDETGGIGLQNIKRRLDLLYGGKYRLEIKDSNGTYTCELYLDLDHDKVPGSR